MEDKKHYESLISMYAASPINAIYKPVMTLSERCAEIEIEASEKYHHSAGGVHGSVFFKLLDDAAFFAASTIEKKVHVLTISFTTYFTRQVSYGRLKAIGKVVNQNNSQFIAESVLYDSDGREIGRGNGILVRGKLSLVNSKGYA